MLENERSLIAFNQSLILTAVHFPTVCQFSQWVYSNHIPSNCLDAILQCAEWCFLHHQLSFSTSCTLSYLEINDQTFFCTLFCERCVTYFNPRSIRLIVRETIFINLISGTQEYSKIVVHKMCIVYEILDQFWILIFYLLSHIYSMHWDYTIKKA